MTNWVRSNEPNEVPLPALHPLEAELLSVQWRWLSLLIFYGIREKRGGATKLLNSSHWRGSAFSFFMAQCIVKDLLNHRPTTTTTTFLSHLRSQESGGRSHRLSANRRICPPPAGWNRPIKSERFKPNRYIVNVVGSKVRRNSQTGGLYSQKVTVNYCLHERQPQVWFTVG